MVTLVDVSRLTFSCAICESLRSRSLTGQNSIACFCFEEKSMWLRLC